MNNCLKSQSQRIDETEVNQTQGEGVKGLKRNSCWIFTSELNIKRIAKCQRAAAELLSYFEEPVTNDGGNMLAPFNVNSGKKKKVSICATNTSSGQGSHIGMHSTVPKSLHTNCWPTNLYLSLLYTNSHTM